jgi:hypothetical protein
MVLAMQTAGCCACTFAALLRMRGCAVLWLSRGVSVSLLRPCGREERETGSYDNLEWLSREWDWPSTRVHLHLLRFPKGAVGGCRL